MLFLRGFYFVYQSVKLMPSLLQRRRWHGEAVTDEEITFYQHENALLIHHFVVPLPRWGRLF